MAFWKPGAADPGPAKSDTLEDVDPSEVVYNQLAGSSIAIQRRSLPAFEERLPFLHAVETHGVVIVVGETGSGKSTQLPQYLFEAGWASGGREIICTQPRRVAAQSLAARVAEEMGCTLGREVGYSIRFEDCSHPTLTRIKYATDGVLLRELLTDPLLSRYGVVMIDEAHERSITSDLLLALLKRVRAARPDLRLVVSSATLEATKFQRYFDARVTPGRAVVDVDTDGDTDAEGAAAVVGVVEDAAGSHLEDDSSASEGDGGDEQQSGQDDQPDGGGGANVNVIEIAAPAAVSSVSQTDGRIRRSDSGSSSGRGRSSSRLDGTQQQGPTDERHHHRRRHHSKHSKSRKRSRSRSTSRHRHRHHSGSRHRDKHNEKETKPSRESKHHRHRDRHRSRSRSGSRNDDRQHRKDKRQRDSSRSRFDDHTAASPADAGVTVPLTDEEAAERLIAKLQQQLQHRNASTARQGQNNAVESSLDKPTGSVSEAGNNKRQSRWGDKAQVAAAAAPPAAPLPAPLTRPPAPAPVPPSSSLPPPVPPPFPPLPPPRQPVAPSASTSNTVAMGAPLPQASAQVDLSSSFSSCCVLTIPGRAYPVEVCYTDAPVSDYVRAAAETVLAIHTADSNSSDGSANTSVGGDILVFLPGVEDIDTCGGYIREALGDGGDDSDYEDPLGGKRAASSLHVCPLHAHLTAAQQLAVIEPGRVDASTGRPAQRKVILATNIAETSLTIPSVTVVIDTGYVKIPYQHPGTGVSALITVPVSQAQARQRAGRAGRVRRGTCYRLYPEAVYRALPHRSPPEVVRSDASQLVLSLLALGVHDVAHVSLLDPPQPGNMIRALEQMHALQAVEATPSRQMGDNGVSRGRGIALSRPIGVALADLPTTPATGSLLLASMSQPHRCADLAITTAALTEACPHGLASLFRGGRPAVVDAAMRQFAAGQGDHVTMLNVYMGWVAAGGGGGGGDTRAQKEWCTEHLVHHHVLQKAQEGRQQLRRACAALVARQQESRAAAAAAANGVDEQRGDDDIGADSNSLWSLTSAHEAAADTPEEGAAAAAAAEALCRCLLRAYPLNVARLSNDGTYRTLREGHRAAIHRGSVLSRFATRHPPELIVFQEAVWTGHQQDVAAALIDTPGLALSGCTVVKTAWLLEEVPHVYQTNYGKPGGWAGPDYLKDVTVSGNTSNTGNKPMSAAADAPQPIIAPKPAARVQYKSAEQRKREAEAEEEAAASHASKVARVAAAPSGSASASAAPPPPTSASGGVAAMMASLFQPQPQQQSSESSATRQVRSLFEF